MANTANPGLARDVQGEIDEVDLIPVRTYWQMVRRRFLRNRLAVIALVLLVIMLALALIVPTLTGDMYKKTSLVKPYGGAEWGAPLGYDDIGQNIFLRLMKALQTSLFIGFAAVSIIFVVGVSVGSIAGYFAGWVDNLLMRVVDVVLSLPSLFLVIMLVAFFGGGQRVGHRLRHRLDRLDDGCSTRARHVPFVARGRFRPGCSGPRRQPLPDHHAAHAAQRPGSDPRGDHTRHCRLRGDRKPPCRSSASASRRLMRVWAT